MVSYTKYSLVPTDEPKEKKDVKPNNLHSPAFDYSSAFNYKSAFEYGSNNTNQFQSVFVYGYGPKGSADLGIGEPVRKKKKRIEYTIMDIVTFVVTVLSYLFLMVTFPCTLWFCFKRLKQWERLIVFRLGRLKGVLGPGVVFVIPLIDKYTRVDMRTKAFSVPPQQLITADNGIVEMGCEVKYRISDVEQLTTSVTTPEHGMRSFGKTVMLNVLTKHTVREMERDRLLIAGEVLKQLNSRVLNWGIEIGQVELSNILIIKEGEPTNPLKPFLSAYGVPGMGSESSGFGSSISSSASSGSAAASLLDFATMKGLPGFSFGEKVKNKSADAGPTLDLLDQLTEAGALVQLKGQQVQGHCQLKAASCTH